MNIESPSARSTLDVATAIERSGIVAPPAATLAETAYLQLRRDIVRGLRAPGEKLRVEHLRNTYQIGASPLREALSRLASSRLVIARGQQGFQVAPVSVADLLELTKTRVWAQTLALRAAIAIGDRDWEAGLAAALHRLTQRPSEIGLDTWDRYHTEFHEALVIGCRSPYLIDHCAALQDLSDRYRWLSLMQSQGVRDTQGEHRALVEAVLSRDATRVGALIADHLIKTAEILLAHLGSEVDAAQLVVTLRRDIAAVL